MLRPDTSNPTLFARARLLVKYALFPGTNWITRDKSRVVKLFLRGTPERPVRTLDCGCGNAYFAHQAVVRGSRCTGITIHQWEKLRCEEMRCFLGLTEAELQLRLESLASLAADPDDRGKYDQVLLLDVIEHILDAGGPATDHTAWVRGRARHVTTPNRDWQGNADRTGVMRDQDG